MARWGMPSSQKALMDAAKKRAEKLQAKGQTVDFKELLRMEPDSGTTNIRNISSAHWKRWLGPETRCLAPFTSFSEFDTINGKKTLCGLRLTKADRCCALLACGPMDIRSESKGERGYHRHLRVSDLRAEGRGWQGASQGHARHPDDARGA